MFDVYDDQVVEVLSSIVGFAVGAGNHGEALMLCSLI